MTATCAAWRAKNLRDTDRFTKKLAAEELRGARGFSCDPGTTCTRREALARTRSGDTLRATRRSATGRSATTLPDLGGTAESEMAALLATTKRASKTLASSKSAPL